MNQLNQIIIEGKVATEPKLNQSITTTVCSVVISTERTYKNSIGKFEKVTSEFEIISYGSLAEMITKKVKVGDEIRCIGRLKLNKWTDSNGKKHSSIGIVAEFLEKKGDIHE